MKKTMRFTVLLVILALIVCFMPNMSNATTTPVNDETTLLNAITNAGEGDEIVLENDITITAPIGISGKNIVINGNGNAIIGNYPGGSGNQSLITSSGTGTSVELKNLTLKNSPKYGVQAYDGGYVKLNGVSIFDCTFGGVLVNAGTVEIVDLDLGFNGENGVNNGIEISKSQYVTSQNEPVIKMNGTLSSTETENVIRFASDANDATTSFSIENTATTTNKILMSSDRLVVTDEDNRVLFESNEKKPGTDATGNDVYVANPVVKLVIKNSNQTVEFDVTSGTILDKASVISRIDLQDLGLSSYEIEGFYADENYTQAFDFNNPITTDTKIYVNVSEVDGATNEVATSEEKDDTPKTGVNHYLGIVVLVAGISIFSIAVVNRKSKNQ